MTTFPGHSSQRIDERPRDDVTSLPTLQYYFQDYHWSSETSVRCCLCLSDFQYNHLFYTNRFVVPRSCWSRDRLLIIKNRVERSQFPSRCFIFRGVTRLDGARGKKQVWPPRVWTWGLSEVNLPHLRKYLWHCWESWLFGAAQWFGARGIMPPSLRPCLSWTSSFSTTRGS